jgi:hypothetical protein
VGWAAFLLGVPNALFSAALVQHSTSVAVALVYLVCAPLVVLMVLRFVPRLDEGRSRWLLLGFFVVAAVVFAVVYPIADGRRAGGGGTDADDALDLAVRAVLRGQYPYLERTYLNNPITPLLGWIGLAVPFVEVFGRAAYLNVFWLGVWLVLLVSVTRSAWLALLLAVVTFVVFPGVSITYLNGSDSFASVVAICLLVVCMQRVPWPVLAVLSGVVLSSRFNVVLLLPVLAAMLGGRRGVGFGALAGVVWVGVSFAPWLVDSADFSPLHTYGMLGRFDSVIPHFGLLVPALTGLMAVWLAWKVARAEVDAWLAMALVLSVPVVVDFAAELALTRQLDLWPLVYGVMATPLWVFASLPAVTSALSERRAQAQPPFWRLAARSASASRS